jgi:hypothetical protein
LQFLKEKGELLSELTIEVYNRLAVVFLKVALGILKVAKGDG